MKLVKLSLAMAALLAAACNSDGTDGAHGANGRDGEPGKPGESPSARGESSVSLVTPARGILDRELEVSIGGSGTEFADGVKPSFGPGIEVIEVTTSTRTLITAKLRIAKNAQVGPRTVTIGALEAERAFTVMPAIDVVAAGGRRPEVAQGGIIELGIENNDARAFDPSSFQLDAGELIDLGSQATGPQVATGLLLAAPLAKTGATQISVANLDATGKPRLSFSSAADALSVKPRAATSFIPGASSEETFASTSDTKLFKLTNPGGEAAIVDYHVEVPVDGTAVPVAFVFGAKGTKDDRLGQVLPGRNQATGGFNPPPYDLHFALPVAPGSAAVDHYVVIADLGGKAGSKAKLTATRSPAQVAIELAEPHTPATPQLVGAVTAASGQIVNAELSADTEVDAYKFTVDAGAKLQLTASSDVDLEIVLTKDPSVLEDPQGTAPAERKVLGYLYPGKQSAAQRVTKDIGATTEVYAVVQPEARGTVKTGKYALGLRKLP